MKNAEDKAIALIIKINLIVNTLLILIINFEKINILE
tara:strand:+ start:58 stop:168 length:111 start_codon:yes stop_codon:yes gene_type:complete